jgi:hypothetical protein
MAKNVQTIEWNDYDERDPANQNLGGWEELDEPIDVDIDEGIYVENPHANMLDTDKRTQMKSKKVHRGYMRM